MAEHSAVNRRVVSSSLTWGAIKKALIQGFFHFLLVLFLLKFVFIFAIYCIFTVFWFKIIPEFVCINRYKDAVVTSLSLHLELS